MSTPGVRWRYLRLLMEEVPDIARLDALGDQGWELAARGLAPGQIGVYEWLFKRQVAEVPVTMPEPFVRPETNLRCVAEAQEREASQVRDEGLAYLETKAQRKVGQWSEEARQRARERGLAQAAKRRSRPGAQLQGRMTVDDAQERVAGA